MGRILVVDDDPDFQEIVGTVLRANGHQVTASYDGKDALARMRAERPDLVLLDVMMSYILDGLHVSQEMQADPGLHNIPVIMISSIAGSPYAGMFPTDQHVSIDEWISKPVDPAALLSKVAKYVA